MINRNLKTQNDRIVSGNEPYYTRCSRTHGHPRARDCSNQTGSRMPTFCLALRSLLGSHICSYGGIYSHWYVAFLYLKSFSFSRTPRLTTQWVQIGWRVGNFWKTGFRPFDTCQSHIGSHTLPCTHQSCLQWTHATRFNTVISKLCSHTGF